MVALCLFVMMLLSTCCAQTPKISLQISGTQTLKKTDGSQVPVVNPEQTFEVVITVEGRERSTSDIDPLPGIENFSVIGQRTSTSVQMINGAVTSNVQTFMTLQPTKEGSFTLGPATIRHEGKSISSASAPITVSKNVQIQQQTAPSHHMQQGTPTQPGGQTSVFCKISADQRNVVIGQPITFSITIGTKGPIMELAGEKPQFQGFIVKEIKQPQISQTTVNGQTYRVQENKFVLIPLQEGTHTIEPVKIVYSAPVQRQQRGRGFFDDDLFSSFFGSQVERKQIASNDLKISVGQLPAYKGTIDGIGSFSSYTAAISKHDASVNEPLTLSITIAGKGNLDQIATPKLVLPATFKYYESKSTTDEDLTQEYRGGKKTFEFIVQASQTGSWQIPPQEFTFYDIATKTFKKLASTALSITVKPAEQNATTVRTLSPPQQHSEDTVETEQNKNSILQDINFIQEEYSVKTPHPLPWWFVLLALCFLLVLAQPTLRSTVSSLIKRCFRLSPSISHAHFTSELEAIIKAGNVHALHQFFSTVLASNNTIDKKDVTEDWIEQMLHKKGWSYDKISDFLEYFSLCAQYHFTQAKKTLPEQEAILKKAQYWFVLLSNNRNV